MCLVGEFRLRENPHFPQFSFHHAAMVMAFVAFFVVEENFFEALKPFHFALNFGFVKKLACGKMARPARKLFRAVSQSGFQKVA